METTLRTQVEGWLKRLGSTPVEMDDAQTDWHLRFDYPAKSPHIMHAAQPKGQPDMVVILSALDVGHEHLKVFEELDEDSQNTFLLDLKETLTNDSHDFKFEGVEKELDCPKKILVQCTRYEDGLSLDSFARSVGAVFKGFLRAILVMRRHLRENGPGNADRFDFKKLGI